MTPPLDVIRAAEKLVVWVVGCILGTVIAVAVILLVLYLAMVI